MRILLIKMSSMGDVFHTFPALTDLLKVMPDVQLDWVVEEAFSDIPTWHPAVNQVFPIALRRWRKDILKRKTREEIKAFFKHINQNEYDMVLDAQGLFKSAWVAKRVHSGVRVGLDKHSAREAFASVFYHRKIAVDKGLHAITRLRRLFALAFDYALPNEAVLHYGLQTEGWNLPESLPDSYSAQGYWVFLHGTTWETKLWPESDWAQLLEAQIAKGEKVVLPWGTKEERLRALMLADPYQNHQAWVPDEPLGLNEMAKVLKFAKGIVSVDTGLSHVAAALGTPMVVLYRVTDPVLVGALGEQVTHLVSPHAQDYLKRFSRAGQAEHSLENLSVASVLERLEAISG